jgi:hypothetical protein
LQNRATLSEQQLGFLESYKFWMPHFGANRRIGGYAIPMQQLAGS